MGCRLLLVAILGLFLLAACSTASNDSPDAGGVDSAASGAAPRSEAAAAAPSSSGASGQASPGGNSAVDPAASPISGVNKPRGGKLVRLYVDPPTLDPHLTSDARSSTLVVEVFGGLVTIDPDLNIAPDLASSWDVSPDGRVYTFHINPEATFHNGKPVTAEDVRWSLERVTDPATRSPVADQYLGDIVGLKAKLAGAAESIEGVRVIDAQTIEITIDAAKSYFLAKLTYPTSFVLDRENVEADPRNWLRQPNGTGPFKLAQYEVGEIIRLTRYDGYHLGPPYLDEVEFILSGGSGMLMYENDEIDLTGVGLADLERVRDPRSPLNSELQRAPPAFSTSYLGMNVNQPPLDDPKVRQALNYAIDKPGIARVVLEDLVVAAKGIIPPGFPGFNPELVGYSYDPERARRLLQESTYGNNLEEIPRITLTTPGSFGATVSPGLEAILRSWEQELGVQVDIQQTEWATFLQDLHGRRFQMFSVAWIADYPDPENFLDVLFHSKSDNNQTTYNNPEVDALLEQARVEQDRAARFRLYNRIEQMIIDDAPWVPLWHTGENFVLIKPEIKDYYLVQLTIPKLRYVYISDE